MRYDTPIISPPFLLRDAVTNTIDSSTSDTYFITVVPFKFPEYTLGTPVGIKPQVKNSFYIEQDSNKISDIKVEGQDLIFTIKLTRPAEADTTVDWNLTFEKPSLGKDFKPSHIESENYLVEDSHNIAVAGDFAVATGTESIITGDQEVQVTINTTDDGVNTLSEHQYRFAKITLSNPTGDTAIYSVDSLHEAYLLLSDASLAPVVEGGIVVDIKMHELAEYEPLLDPETSGQVTFDIGQDLDGKSNLRSKVIDDTPIKSFQFTPEDVVDVDGLVDYLTVDRYYQVIIQSGRRD